MQLCGYVYEFDIGVQFALYFLIVADALCAMIDLRLLCIFIITTMNLCDDPRLLDELYRQTKTLWGKWKRPEAAVVDSDLPERQAEDGLAGVDLINVDEFHRLEHHCADVAACLECMLDDPVPHRRLAKACGRERLCEVTKSRLAVIAFVHDIGKINCGFQFQINALQKSDQGNLRKCGHIKEAFQLINRKEYVEALGLEVMGKDWGNNAFCELFLASVSHHGRPESFNHRSGSDNNGGPPELWCDYSNYSPLAAAKLIGALLPRWFPAAFEPAEPLPDSPEFVHLFAGMMVTADQLGSDTRFFKFKQEPDPDYINNVARIIAREAVEKTNLFRGGWCEDVSDVDVHKLFGYDSLRPPQQAVSEAPLDAQLLILESETGSGKTEAAVIRFVKLFSAGLVDGLYFALPTRAAAKQLHGRVQAALSRYFPDSRPIETTMAIPGYLQSGLATGYGVPGNTFAVYWDDNPSEWERMSRWSSESVRHFLNSPAAVGTIDQVLMSALQVKWAHLRGAGLARNLLVVDEVHASDAYMTETLCRVIKAHLGAGGFALLMSATLGSAARSKLANTHTSQPPRIEFSEAVDYPYPALTVADNIVSESGYVEFLTHSIAESNQQKKIAITAKPIMANSHEVARLALDSAKLGARVLVIRNTVACAQATLDALIDLGGEDLAFQVKGVTTLHHSRFAAEDRGLLDAEVEKALGSGKQRLPGGCVVIGTQTLEQSLDIDADYLITDLCPADVLLQRNGRLHRHSHNQRVAQFAAPTCVVLTPENGLATGLGGGLMKFGLGCRRHDASGVYRDLLALESTRLLIDKHPVWEIPNMNRQLTEQSTHPDKLEDLASKLGDEWTMHGRLIDGTNAAERNSARFKLIDRSQSFNEAPYDCDEHVYTRLGESGLRIMLDKEYLGPFGQNVRFFNIPQHMLEKQVDNEEPNGSATEASQAVKDQVYPAETSEDGLVIKIESTVLAYDRRGIRKI